MEYCLVSSPYGYNAEDFCAKVQERIADGWECQGGIAMSEKALTGSTSGGGAAQAMVRKISRNPSGGARKLKTRRNRK